MWWLACAPAPQSPVPEPTAPTAPTAQLPLPAMQLARAQATPVWTVQIGEAHGTLLLEVEGGGETRRIERQSAESHTVQLVGLVPGAPHTATATLTRDDGSYVLGPLPFATDPVPDAVKLPFELLAHDPQRADPGWLLFSPYTPDGPFFPALLLDAALQIRWWWFPTSWMMDLWSLVERLETTRVGFTSLTLKGEEGYDWTHANGLARDADGGVIVSLRNQDAIVRFDANGDLDWILGDPLGWSEAFVPHLLAPVGQLSWFYHQHAPEWHDDEHLLVVFDNQSYGYTPYGTPPEGPLYSRVVGYEIDAVTRTVRQRFAFGETSTGPLYARVMGDADLLPNGDLLADFGYLEREGEDLPYDEQGLGRYGVRIVEFDPERPDAPALDLRLVSDGQIAPSGFQLYRARKIAQP